MDCSNDRIPMRPGIYEFSEALQIQIEKLISKQGATCLVYKGSLPSNGRKVIVKEFYPYSLKNNAWAIDRDERDQKLKIHSMSWENSEFQARKQQFMRSYQLQKTVYQEPQFLEVVVEPQYLASYGDSWYIISDYHNGKSLDEVLENFKDFQDIIHLFHYLADVISVFERNGYLFLDICAENFLVIQQTETHYQLRLFDMDSIIKLDDIHEAEGNIFFHKEYASKEFENLERALKTRSFDEVKHSYLEPSVMVYSLGVLFYKILFGKNLNLMGEVDVSELQKRYQISSQTAEHMLNMIRCMLADQDVRYQMDYSSCRNVLKHLNVFAEEMSYELYVSQREAAQANATFAAYHMLEKYPLFQYVEDTKALKVLLAGSHWMREGFVSAIISVGQMLHSSLEIGIISEDAEEFWESYVSEEKNSGLKEALTVEVNGKPLYSDVNRKLVGRALAHIRIFTELKEKTIKRLIVKEHYRYVVLFDTFQNNHWYQETIGSYLGDGEKAFVGFVQCKKEEQLEHIPEGAVIHRISGYYTGDDYHEGMYQERVYRMGLRMHAYYGGCLDDPEATRALEEGYRKDIYSRKSSERAALHGIYKMASVGVDYRMAGSPRAFDRKLQDEEVLEALGWLEHLSWTAYMLTSGHLPVEVEEMNHYAYQSGNDWKDKRNPLKMRHPLLVSSLAGKRLPKNDWNTFMEDDWTGFDELDRVSFWIFEWYFVQKKSLQEKFAKSMEHLKNTGSLTEEFIGKLADAGQKCIEHMGEKQNDQDMSYVKKWKEVIAKEDQRMLEEVIEMMRPVIDSYRNRDFKQADRDMLWAVSEICRP